MPASGDFSPTQRGEYDDPDFFNLDSHEYQLFFNQSQGFRNRIVDIGKLKTPFRGAYKLQQFFNDL